jgi:hypothetical protein
MRPVWHACCMVSAKCNAVFAFIGEEMVKNSGTLQLKALRNKIIENRADDKTKHSIVMLKL